MNPGALAVLGEIADYREAARAIVESERPARERLVALIDLHTLASDSAFPRAAEGAVWDEARTVLYGEPPAWRGNLIVAKARRLRAKGHAECPSCGLRVPTDEDLARWRAAFDVYVAEVHGRDARGAA